MEASSEPVWAAEDRPPVSLQPVRGPVLATRSKEWVAADRAQRNPTVGYRPDSVVEAFGGELHRPLAPQLHDHEHVVAVADQGIEGQQSKAAV
jgi:hypothetical protein